MLDFERGASDDPNARLKGEILASLSTWAAEFELERLELAWAVTQMLLKHVNRSQPIDVYVEFLERLSAIAGEEARELRRVVGEDFRRRAH